MEKRWKLYMRYSENYGPFWLKDNTAPSILGCQNETLIYGATHIQKDRNYIRLGLRV